MMLSEVCASEKCLILSSKDSYSIRPPAKKKSPNLLFIAPNHSKLCRICVGFFPPQWRIVSLLVLDSNHNTTLSMNIPGDRNNLTTQIVRQPEADTSNVTGVGNYMVLPLACFGLFWCIFGQSFCRLRGPKWWKLSHWSMWSHCRKYWFRSMCIVRWGWFKTCTERCRKQWRAKKCKFRSSASQAMILHDPSCSFCVSSMEKLQKRMLLEMCGKFSPPKQNI